MKEKKKLCQEVMGKKIHKEILYNNLKNRFERFESYVTKTRVGSFYFPRLQRVKERKFC